MRERIAYFLRMLADSFDSYGSFPVFVSNDEGYALRYFDPERKCIHYDGLLLQGGYHVATETLDRFRVVLQTGDCNCCAEPVYWLGLEFQKKDHTWQPILLVHETKLSVLQTVLDKVGKHIALQPAEDRTPEPCPLDW